MSTQKPTIVFVHGAFAESASWNPVIERLYHHDPVLVAAHNRPFREVVAVANPLRSVSPAMPPTCATFSARSTGRSCSSGTRMPAW